MFGVLIDFICRLLVTLIILVPALTAIVVACTIIYDKDFRKNKPQNSEKETKPSSIQDKTDAKQ